MSERVMQRWTLYVCADCRLAIDGPGYEACDCGTGLEDEPGVIEVAVIEAPALEEWLAERIGAESDPAWGVCYEHVLDFIREELTDA